MVVDSKQMNNGSVKLDKITSGDMQLSREWIENVFRNTGDSEIKTSLSFARQEGRIETYVAAADKA